MLRTRLSLLLVLALLVALVAFGLAAELLFARQQRQQLDALLLRDLERVQQLVESSVLGAQFIERGRGGFELQFVSSDGQVRLTAEPVEPLPLFERPTVVRENELVRLVAAVPWHLPTGTEIGTIRLALDVSDAFAARQTLLRSLLVGGVVIAVLALIAGLVLLRRTLAPLAALSDQAADIDPAEPKLTDYRGPDDEVASLARALNQALEGIRERQQAERDALAEVAHELAAPLTVVAGQLEVAAADGDPRLVSAHQAALELLHTSQDLLTLARGELALDLELRVVELRELIQGLVAEYPGVAFSTDGAVEVLGDRERLRQAIRNLVRNAVQATGDPAEVAVQLQGEGDEVRLEVRDQGPGLEEEALRRVFERHYSRRGGSGLGLAVTQAIVRRHEGRIEVQSRLGEGSRFIVWLPSLEAQLES